jgi:hypothetical protein
MQITWSGFAAGHLLGVVFTILQKFPEERSQLPLSWGSWRHNPT